MVDLLLGITWDHERGRAPLEAATQRFTAAHPEVAISWEARSLREFEEVTVAELAGRYDLLAIDHPLIGQAYQHAALAPLDDLLPGGTVAEIVEAAVGASGPSYAWDGRTWAAPMDAATQVSAHRPDLLAAAGVTTPPATWEEVFALADQLPPRSMTIAANPTHLLCCWLSLCHDLAADRGPHLDGRPAWWGEDNLDRDTTVAATRMLYRLLDLVDPHSFDLDPIGLLDQMSTGRHIIYAPLVYGYVTYVRPDSAKYPVRFTDAPSHDGRPSGTVLGGVGLAVSATSSRPDLAAQFVEFVTSPGWQRGEYAGSGGQPACRHAWTDPALNAATDSFFAATLATVDAAMLRPREPAYPAFQHHAGHLVHKLATQRAPAGELVSAVNQLWRERTPNALRRIDDRQRHNRR